MTAPRPGKPDAGRMWWRVAMTAVALASAAGLFACGGWPL